MCALSYCLAWYKTEQIIIIFLCLDKCHSNYKFGLTLERVDRSYMQHKKKVILIIDGADR